MVIVAGLSPSLSCTCINPPLNVCFNLYNLYKDLHQTSCNPADRRTHNPLVFVANVQRFNWLISIRFYYMKSLQQGLISFVQIDEQYLELIDILVIFTSWCQVYNIHWLTGAGAIRLAVLEYNIKLEAYPNGPFTFLFWHQVCGLGGWDPCCCCCIINKLHSQHHILQWKPVKYPRWLTTFISTGDGDSLTNSFSVP